MIEYACRTAGAAQNPLSDPAMELLFRASRGLRFAAKLLHAALRAADQRGQAFLDDSVMTTAITDLRLDLPSAPDPPKPRPQTGTRSRK